MDLIIQHRSEFPSKLKTAIEEALEDAEHLSSSNNPLADASTRRRSWHYSRVNPKVFLKRVYEAVKVFFLGVLYRATDAYEHHHWLLGWYGLDDTVDTVDEAEVAIRCFPQILNQTTHLERTGLHRALPIHMLLVNAQTVTFVPLFGQLGHELGTFSDGEKGGLASCKNLSVVGQLLCNTMAATAETSRAQFLHRAPNTDKVDEASMAVLVRIRELGLVTQEDIRSLDLVMDLLDASSYREAGFIETRLRFLIDWEPNLLLNCDNDGSNLLHASCVFQNFRHKERFCGKGVEVRIFEVIFERGIQYFPKQVGFLFHHDIFKLACQRMGTMVVKEMVRDKLLGTLAQQTRNRKQLRSAEKNGTNNMTLQTLVVAAASNEDISLDGIYTLIRFDPTIALMPQCSVTSSC